MAIDRTLEPEIGSGPDEAWLYHEMDHRAVNTAFVDDLFAGGPVGPRVVDLGCGPAAIAIQIARRFMDAEDVVDSGSTGGPGEAPSVRADDFVVMGLDLDVEMLEIAKRQIEIEGLLGRVMLQQADVKDLSRFESGFAETVVSNSVAHHLPDPGRLIAGALHLAGPHGRVFVRDLVRPDSTDRVEELVAEHGEGEPPQAIALLRQSLMAGLTVDEVREILAGLDIPADSVQMTSDRHWTLDWQPTRET